MRKQKSTIGFIFFVVLFITGESAFASRLWPFQLGQTYTYIQSDALDNSWSVTLHVDGYLTNGSQNYFNVWTYNFENYGEVDNWGHLRSTENFVYYSPGDDFIGFQTAPVGTKWVNYDDEWDEYIVTEIIAIEPVTVPYGHFEEAYVHYWYICDDPDEPTWVDPDGFDWIVPGVGWVKNEDYAVDGPAPYIMELVDITQNCDLSGDHFVGLEDFAIIAKWWLDDCDVSNDFCDGADFDLSGQVTLDNLLTVVQEWLEGERIELRDIEWVSISNYGFSGQMSVYETTNAQYAQYLNAALASGAITVGTYHHPWYGNIYSIRGATGSYAGEIYYGLDGPGWTGGGATNGGKSRISYSGGTFTVDGGFENHPVTHVSWYGATAFASYYGWRLPTEWEWEAVASYTDGRTYATGNSLYDSQKFLANYRSNGDNAYTPNNLPYHPWVVHGTSEVGYFGTFGYGLADMSGNVWEWTSSVSGSSRVIRGGGWGFYDDDCTVSGGYHIDHPYYLFSDVGFRVCR